MTEQCAYGEGDRIVVAYGSWCGQHGAVSRPGSGMIRTEVHLDNYSFAVMLWANNLRPESAIDQLGRVVV